MRIILVLALSTLTLFSCKEKRQIEAARTPLQNESLFADTPIVDDDEALLETILQQLNLKKEQCYLRFVTKKPVPGHENLTI